MALITPSGLISSIKGSIGGTTFSNNRAGLTGKTRTVGKRLLNTKQAGALNKSTLITWVWNQLSPTVKSNYNDYALANTYTNRFGVTKALTGYQWYKQLSQTSVYFTGNALFEVLAYSIPAPLYTFSVTLDSSTMVITWSTPIDPSLIYLYCYTTAPTRSGARLQRGSYRMTDVRSYDVTSSFDIITAWEAAHNMVWADVASGATFNIGVLFYAVSRTSFNTGIAQTAYGSISP